MKVRSILRMISAMLVLMLAVSLAACGDKPSSQPSSGSMIEASSSLSSSSSSSESSSETTSSDSTSSDSASSSSTPGAVPKDTRSPADIQKDLLSKMIAHHQKNEDTIGWLYVPGTTISDVVVQTSDNDYYLRRNNLAKQDFNGSYFADFRGIYGKRENLSRNSVIYGHSMSDDPNGIKFGQLNKYLDKTFATENQFIYFSTPESEMVWQIFSVMDTTEKFNYIKAEPTDAEMLNIINGARSRSKFNFDVKVSATDKILTLSTCTYRHDKNYPNIYRYVVMAKLVEKGAAQTPAKVEANPSIAQP